MEEKIEQQQYKEKKENLLLENNEIRFLFNQIMQTIKQQSKNKQTCLEMLNSLKQSISDIIKNNNKDNNDIT